MELFAQLPTLLVMAAIVAILALYAMRPTCEPGMATTLLRMLLFRGWHLRGEMSSIRFPVRLSDLTRSSRGPALLTAMLRHNGHLPDDVRVAAIVDEAADIRDGVKGDKGLITVEYAPSSSSAAALLPRRFFVKFNVGAPNGMRLLVETSECAK